MDMVEKDLLPLKWLILRKQSTAFTHLRSRKDDKIMKKDSRTLSTSFTVELKGNKKKKKKKA